VDIDGSVLANAAPAFRELGLDSGSILKPVSDDGHVDFDDGFFDVVLSDQVLEHVAEPGVMLTAMARVLKTEGVMFHCFPAHLGPVECHLRMPFVHWLPKNNMRKMLIAIWVRAGIDPGWQELSGATVTERIRTYHEYSVQNTFYRAPRDWRTLFESTGFSPEFVSHLAPGVMRLRRALAPLMGEGLVNWLMTNGRMVYLSARRSDSVSRTSSSDHMKIRGLK
jgi:ubiquinone/menaquinone biosynthesis C-methylase UbiE